MGDLECLQSLGEHVVDVAAAVDQHLLDSAFVDHWTHEHRVLIWVVKLEPLICPAEGD